MGTRAAIGIYAAGFAAHSNSVYLASYSGRVVVVDENGEGLRVYDICQCLQLHGGYGFD